MNIIRDHKLNCAYCNYEKDFILSWPNSTLYRICKNCNKETKYQFKDWKLTTYKKL